MKTIYFYILLLISINIQAADNFEIFVVAVKKQEAKKNVSWNLADWMATKRKIALMDQWLALNSSATIFELSLDASTSDYKKRIDTDGIVSKTSHSGNRYSAKLNITILGFGYDYTQTNEKYTSRDMYLALRVFGKSEQGTNINAIYGYRKLYVDNDAYNNNFFGASSSIYLMRYLGLTGQTRHYITRNSKLKNKEISGNLNEGGIFLDLSFLRLYAVYFKDKQNIKNSSEIKAVSREGTRYGASLNF